MRKSTRKARLDQQRRLKEIEAEARRKSQELAEKDPARLQEEIRALDAQRAVVLQDRYVVWAFDCGPAGRPVEAYRTAADVVTAARAWVRRQVKTTPPAVQLPGGGFWPRWPQYEAHPESCACGLKLLDLALAAKAAGLQHEAVRLLAAAYAELGASQPADDQS